MKKLMLLTVLMLTVSFSWGQKEPTNERRHPFSLVKKSLNANQKVVLKAPNLNKYLRVIRDEKNRMLEVKADASDIKDATVFYTNYDKRRPTACLLDSLSVNFVTLHGFKEQKVIFQWDRGYVNAVLYFSKIEEDKSSNNENIINYGLFLIWTPEATLLCRPNGIMTTTWRHKDSVQHYTNKIDWDIKFYVYGLK